MIREAGDTKKLKRKKNKKNPTHDLDSDLLELACTPVHADTTNYAEVNRLVLICPCQKYT